MAKEIIWSPEAVEDRVSILAYWNMRNSSKNYSIRLDNEFLKIAELISRNPKIGKNY